jgi:isocitrate/isopropylmalate dehydrogenase
LGPGSTDVLKLAVLPGDGIGPEITEAALQVLQYAIRTLSLDLTVDVHEVGLSALQRTGTTLPPAVLDACRKADGVMLGPVSTASYPPRDQGGVNASAALRIELDLFANVRPSRTRAGLPYWGRTPMDLVIVRENTEGFYADRSMHLGTGELMPSADLALSIRKISAAASARIARAAFELAASRRRHVTAVHKANVLGITEGLFLREVRSVAGVYPHVDYDEQLVDSMAALLVRDASRFDVIVTTNMFGDILSDEAAELSGSLGLAGSINFGERHGMAQAQHGSAPDIQGQNKANPTSLVLSSAMLLDWLGRRHRQENFTAAARLIEQSVDMVLSNPARRTFDLGGPLGTDAFTSELCKEIDARARH